MQLVHDNIIMMSPEQYLKLACPFGHAGGPQLDPKKVEAFAKTGWNNPPMLSVKETMDGKLQVGLHDGRHRATAAIKRGDSTIEVAIVRGKRFAKEHPEVSDADMAKLVVDNGILPEINEMKKLTFKEFLVEMPVQDYQTFGNFEKGSSFRKEQDRKMITAPKAIKNVHKKWGKIPYDFNLYFVNSSKANRYTEVGLVNSETPKLAKNWHNSNKQANWMML
jgi:hypothetical protein